MRLAAAEIDLSRHQHHQWLKARQHVYYYFPLLSIIN